MVPRAFGDTAGMLEISDRLRPRAPVRLDLPSILVSGPLCEGILDLPSEFDAVVRVGDAPFKLTDPRQGVPREASRCCFFGLLSQPAHLLHVSRQDLTGLDII